MMTSNASSWTGCSSFVELEDEDDDGAVCAAISAIPTASASSAVSRRRDRTSLPAGRGDDATGGDLSPEAAGGAGAPVYKYSATGVGRFQRSESGWLREY